MILCAHLPPLRITVHMYLKVSADVPFKLCHLGGIFLMCLHKDGPTLGSTHPKYLHHTPSAVQLQTGPDGLDADLHHEAQAVSRAAGAMEAVGMERLWLRGGSGCGRKCTGSIITGNHH